MRRILMVLTVAAFMAAMMVASALPAFAAPGNGKGATVLPHECFGLGVGQSECLHITTTPTGNVNEFFHLKGVF
jgi:hypothetical protein